MNKVLNLYQKYREVILYILFGGLTTLINLLVYNTMYYYIESSNLLSTIVAWILSVLTAFLTNKQIVFRSSSWNLEILWKEGVKFFECRIGTGILEIIFMYITLTAFLTNKQIVFRSSSWNLEILWKEGVKFFECRIGTGILEIIFMYITVDILRWSGFIMKLIVNVIVIILNYVASKRIIFVKK